MGDRRGDVCPFTVTNAKNECWFLSPSVAQFGSPRACAPAALPVPFPAGLAKLSPHEWPVVGAVAGGNTGTPGTQGHRLCQQVQQLSPHSSGSRPVGYAGRFMLCSPKGLCTTS